MKRLLLACFAVFSVFLFLSPVDAQKRSETRGIESIRIDQVALVSSRLSRARPVNRATLKNHADTPNEYVWNAGKKTYRRIKKTTGGL
jgi:hypothetical protein